MTRLLEQVRQHLPTAAAFAYLSGFIVTNVYLGSLRIINVDILRSRYILTGVLFMIFASIIVAFVDGLLRVLMGQNVSGRRLNRSRHERLSLLRASHALVSMNPVGRVQEGRARRISSWSGRADLNRRPSGPKAETGSCWKLR